MCRPGGPCTLPDGKGKAWCLLVGLLPVALVHALPGQWGQHLESAHGSPRVAAICKLPGLQGQCLAPACESHGQLTSVPPGTAEDSKTWCGELEVISSIQVKTLSKQLNKTFWAPSERSLCQEISKLQWYDPTVGEFHLSGPESPHLDRSHVLLDYLVKDLSNHTAGSSQKKSLILAALGISQLFLTKKQP